MSDCTDAARHDVGSTFHRSGDGPGGASSWLLGSCALVATGAYLGADWLRVDAAGLPAGLWIVGSAWAWGAARAQSRRRTALAAAPAGTVAQHAAMPGTHAAAIGSSPRRLEAAALVPGPIRLGALRAAARVTRATVRAAHAISGNPSGRSGAVRRWEYAAATACDRARIEHAPLRIGLDARREVVRAITEATGSAPVHWIDVTPGEDDQADAERLDLDAIVRQPAFGPLRVSTRVHEDRDAAWYDWARPLPFSYAAVFPVRIDPHGLTLDDKDWIERGGAPVLRLLIDASALLSRSPARLDLADRLRGRGVIDPAAQGPGLPGALTTTIQRLGAAVEEASREGRTSGALRIAARVVGAYHSTHDRAFDLETRCRVIAAAAAILRDEPEAMLRAGAAEISRGEDDAAMASFERAARLLRSLRVEPASIHLAFLQAEIENGTSDPMTLGRVAAGICIAAGTSEPERFAYVRDDIADDLRYAGWLVGRDQDRSILLRVAAEMDQRLNAGSRAPAHARAA